MDYYGVNGPNLTLNCRKISHFVIYNGYNKSTSLFGENARVSRIILTNNATGDVLYDGPLKDKFGAQQINIPANTPGNSNVRSIGIMIPAGCYISGTKYRDLCLSEVQVYGYK